MSKEKVFSFFMNWLPAIIILIVVVFLQTSGYYNRVYYTVEQCGHAVSVRQSNEMEWNSYKEQIEKLNNNPYLLENLTLPELVIEDEQ